MKRRSLINKEVQFAAVGDFLLSIFLLVIVTSLPFIGSNVLADDPDCKVCVSSG